LIQPIIPGFESFNAMAGSTRETETRRKVRYNFVAAHQAQIHIKAVYGRQI